MCESQPDNEAEYGMRLLAANYLDQTSTALALDFTFDAQGTAWLEQQFATNTLKAPNFKVWYSSSDALRLF